MGAGRKPRRPVFSRRGSNFGSSVFSLGNEHNSNHGKPGIVCLLSLNLVNLDLVCLTCISVRYCKLTSDFKDTRIRLIFWTFCQRIYVSCTQKMLILFGV